MIQPLIVAPGKNGVYVLIAGERRLQASRKAGFKTVPVVIRNATDQQLLELAIIENVQRADLNAIVDAAGNIGFSGTETTITGGLTVTGTITNPGSAKAWAVVQSTGTLVVGHNITSAAKDSTGQYTVTWDANFSSANYATLVVPWVEGSANARSAIVLQQDAGACTVQTRSGAPALIDCGFMVVAFGTLA